MVRMELSSYVLEIPNDVYYTRPISYWLSNIQSRVLQTDRLILENDEKATLKIDAPY